jgi:hypothetical protein
LGFLDLLFLELAKAASKKSVEAIKLARAIARIFIIIYGT